MNRKELLDILSIVNRAIPANKTLEGLICFYFSGTNVIGYNSKEFASHPLKTDFSCFVKSTKLMSILSGITEDEVTLTQKKGNLQIKSKRTTAKLQIFNDDEILKRVEKITNSLEKVKWYKLPDNFLESIALCRFAASDKTTGGTETCVSINNTTVTASDNCRIATAELNKKMRTMLIQAGCIPNLIEANPVEYGRTSSWLHFKNEDGCIYSILGVLGKFPDFSKFLSIEGTEVNIPSEALEGIQLAHTLLAGDEAVALTCENNVCTIKAQTEEGSIEHCSDIQYDGDKVSIGISPNFLSHMLKYSTKVTVNSRVAMIESDSFKIITSLFG
jgi:DNA polymerase III sliding clamp (beta) subunit (PCNA family)